MKTNLFKKIFALVLAMSLISIPSLSLAGISETGNELFNLDLTKDYGTGEATDATFADGVYSLEELNAGKYVENGEIKTVETPTVEAYNSVATPTFQIASESPVAVGKMLMEEEFTGTAGFKIPVEPITVGTFELSSQIHPYGAGGMGRTIVNLGGKAIINFVGGGNGIYPCWLTESDATSSNVFKLTLSRTDENSNWEATLAYGWNYLNNTVTGTIPAADLPQITYIAGHSWRSTSAAGTATNLGYKYIKAVHYPVEVATSSCDVTEIRTVQPSIDVKFDRAVNPDTIPNITFTANEENMVTGASLSEDGKTATLTLKNLVDGQIYTLEVPSTVKDLDGVGVTPLTRSVTAKKAKNVLFDIDFSKDYGTAQNGTYSSAELKAAHNAVLDDWAANTSFVVGTGKARLTPTASANGNSGIKVSTGNIAAGSVAFDFKFGSYYNSHGGNGAVMRRITINGKKVLGLAASEHLYLYGADGAVDTTVKHTESNPAGEFNIRVLLSRDDDASDWSMKVYDLSDASAPVVLETTLSKDTYPAITDFGAYIDWVKSGTATNFDFYSLKGEVIDTNALYNIDFSNIEDGTYTTAQINEAFGTKITEANPIIYTVENGVAKISSENGKSVQGTMGFEAITKGCVAFDVSFDHVGTNGSNRARQVFTIKSSTGKVVYLMTDNPNGGDQPFYAAKDHFGDTPRLEFISGDTGYYVGNDDDITHKMRVVVMRADESSDWRVRMYDMAASKTVPILTTTLKAEDFPSIASTYFYIYLNGDEAFAKTIYIPLRKYSANYISMEEMNAVETMKVENSAGAIITNLAGATVVDDGKVNVVADVNRTGGILYAAIYEGDRIIDANMVPVNAMGEHTIPFTVENPTASKSIKLFYWDLNASPITNVMDPLARK